MARANHEHYEQHGHRELHAAIPRYHRMNTKDKVNDTTDTGSFPIVRRKPPYGPRGNARRARIVSSVLVALLSALLGFGYVAQVRNTESSYESLTEDELVRVLDETSTQVDKLEQRKSELNAQLESIQSAADKQEEAARIAAQNETTNGILSGRLPAEGKGITITVTQGSTHVDASTMFTLIEELRNAGAEVISFNSVRIVTSSYIKDTKSGLNVDGQSAASPYTIKAIGNPEDLQNAIQIAGGVGSRLKVQYNAKVVLKQQESVKIDEVRRSPTYKYAKTVE
ncbi:hypothetical protein BAQU_0885 [Bifidobacterium aquikefiri]|uniref:DUF881 domain-containing protein n=2 Tax=Bifidobacterium aquikefiri TaxID=1653207 RepID=A0A261G6H9_9BIFI|nr:hypothetical protein BAQU_0885 [Bifidobacterium aquikefiri]